MSESASENVNSLEIYILNGSSGLNFFGKVFFVNTEIVKCIQSLTHSLTDFESSWVVELELSQRRKVKSIYKKAEQEQSRGAFW